MSKNKKVPESRLGRLAKLGGLAVRVAGDAAVAVASQMSQTRDAALAKLHEEAAAKLLETFGELKGLPMKAGQILSFMDGVIPPEFQPTYQKILAQLQVKSRPIPWESMEAEIVRGLGGPVTAYFSEFEREPVAAASIGQVYRAVTLDGREVAVKVQYPGIRAAMASDRRNITGVFKTLTSVIPRLDVGKLIEDFLSQVEMECDYEREARNQADFAAIWRADPEVIIPPVVGELCRKNILVTEMQKGRSWQEFVAASTPAERNHAGGILFRFVFWSLDEHGIFNADPHPGNYLFTEDGRVIFLDFGCVQRYDDDARRSMIRSRRAALAGKRGAELWPYLADVMQFRREVPEATRKILTDHLLFCSEPILKPQPYRFTRAYTSQVSAATMQMKLEIAKTFLKEGWSEPRRDGLVHLGRIVFGLYSLLAELEATQDWVQLLPPTSRAG